MFLRSFRRTNELSSKRQHRGLSRLKGEGPGTLEARVPVFIDLQLKGDFGAAADWYMDAPHDPGADPLLGFQAPLSSAAIYCQHTTRQRITPDRERAGSGFHRAKSRRIGRPNPTDSLKLASNQHTKEQNS